MSVRRLVTRHPAALGAALAVALVLPIVGFAVFTTRSIESGFAARAVRERESAALLAASVLTRRVDDATLALVSFVDRSDVSAALDAGDAGSLSGLLLQITGVHRGAFVSSGLVDAAANTIVQVPSGDPDASFARALVAHGPGVPGRSARFYPGYADVPPVDVDAFLNSYAATSSGEKFGTVSIAVPWVGATAVLYGHLNYRIQEALGFLSLPPGRSLALLTGSGRVIGIAGALLDGTEQIWMSPYQAVAAPVPGLKEALRGDLVSETIAIDGHARDVTHLSLFDHRWALYVLDDAPAIQASVTPLTRPVVLGAATAAAIALALAVLLAFLLARIRSQQEQLATLAVTEERLRIARNIHDVVGHVLTVIAMRSELAMRVLPRDRAAGTREIADLGELARRGLDDLREIVVGYREPRLASELVEARRALDAAGIACEVEGDSIGLPSHVDALFAWTVRESVTNVIRHSGATTCRIRIARDGDEARVEVFDDGGAGGQMPAFGSGLRGLAERAKARGGVAVAAPVADRGFSVRVAVPLGAA